MGMGGLAETFIVSYQTTWHHISEESSFWIHCRIKYIWFVLIGKVMWFWIGS